MFCRLREIELPINLELENRLDALRRETESLSRENRRLRAISSARLAQLKCLIAEAVEAQRAAAGHKTEMKAWLEDQKAKSRNKF